MIISRPKSIIVSNEPQIDCMIWFDNNLKCKYKSPSIVCFIRPNTGFLKIWHASECYLKSSSFSPKYSCCFAPNPLENKLSFIVPVYYCKLSHQESELNRWDWKGCVEAVILKWAKINSKPSLLIKSDLLVGRRFRENMPLGQCINVTFYTKIRISSIYAYEKNTWECEVWGFLSKIFKNCKNILY